MNFSDVWRSLFPVLSVFPSPPLVPVAAASSSVAPLHLRPLESQVISHQPSIQIPLPLPPSSHLAAFRSFFNSSSFLPHTLLSSLLSSHLLPPSDADDADPTASNILCAIPSRAFPRSAIIFFPTGDNSHCLGISRLLFNGENNKIVTSDISVQQRGFKHPYHRILKLSAVSATPGHDGVVGTTVEGFLIAVTLYSVNWFRVDARVSATENVNEKEKDGVLAVPMAKQGFESSVVDACLCRSWPERSVVLLETGELSWFDMDSKRSGKIRVSEGLGGWLGCEFGGQPWIVMLACESAVVTVDLRVMSGTEHKVLVRMDADRSDRILAFCKSRFYDFHLAVVTKKQLLLFDARRPLVPVLMWDHGLPQPCHVSMFRLSELRPCEEFNWASDSGSAIMVGSFWKDEFSLFFYGPREGCTFGGDSMVYAWELPLCFNLSGQHGGSSDSLVKDDLPNGLGCTRRKDVVAGFWIVPNNLFMVESEHGGFALIRLMLSGKLEMQRYHASWDAVGMKSSSGGGELLEVRDLVVCSMEQNGKSSYRYCSLNIAHLWEHMNGSFPSVMVMHKLQLSHFNRNFPADHLGVLNGIKKEHSTYPISTILNDATIPTSIFEITVRRVLNNLESDLLPLAFSKYSILFGNTHRESTLALLEVPKRSPLHRSVPFFVGNPLRLGEKWSSKTPPGDTLVGPVFPIPVLFLLQWMDNQDISSCLKEEPDDDILSSLCQTTLENVYPEISLAESGGFSEHGYSLGLQNEKSFFVYEKSVVGNPSTCKGSTGLTACAANKELPQAGHTCFEPEAGSEDEKFTTFICGIADKTCNPNAGKEGAGFEMFDQLNPYRLDFDLPSIECQPKEQEMYKRLTRQSCKWLRNYKPHEDFCISSNISKSIQ